MSQLTPQAIEPGFSPINLSSRPLVWQVFAVIAGTLFLTLSSYITVPMVPVPITMQTYAILLVGALYGWRLGAITIIAWLGEAAIGLPVLAGGAGGIQHFFGPTGGYILSWPFIAALVGWLAERGWNGNRVFLAFLSMLIAGTFCLVAGTLWLSAFIGFEPAILGGFLPFLVGDVLKAALGAATLGALGHFTRSRANR
jgi:biotin transport system substrate-specific component